MKTRSYLLLFTLLSLLVFTVSGLAASGDLATEDGIVYFPVILDFSNLLLEDDFSDPNSGWPIDDDGVVQWSYQQGEYQILIRDTGTWAGALAPISGLTNYNIRASMHRQQGSSNDVGLVFDWKDWDNFYYLVADPGDQWFGVAKVVNGVPSILIPRTDSNVIAPGNATNRLRIDRAGVELAVSINGQRLALIKDTPPPGPFRAGLYMESDDDAPAINRYDNVEIWQIDNGLQQRAAVGRMEDNFASGEGFDNALDWESAE